MMGQLNVQRQKSAVVWPGFDHGLDSHSESDFKATLKTLAMREESTRKVLITELNLNCFHSKQTAAPQQLSLFTLNRDKS